MKPSITIDHVYKRLGNRTVLDDISFSCNPGQVCGIVGRNGSGKTVLLKCICGLMPPSQGKIRIFDEELGSDIEFYNRMGIIIETPGFIPQISGMENLLQLAKINNKIGSQGVKEAMSLVGLDPNLKQKVSKYSLGMKQRLGIAQAIMEKPDILLLDEPMNGLDNACVDIIRHLILNLKRQGTTVILASHSKEDIDILCDCVIYLDAGRITKIVDRQKEAVNNNLQG